MRFTLKQLEVFLAVALDESVSEAAERLSMSQSAVSESLKNLESQFDVVLFDRLGLFPHLVMQCPNYKSLHHVVA